MKRLPLRGDIIYINEGNTRGAEIRKPRPCVVVSPDELNRHTPTLIVVPLTSGAHPYAFRVPCSWKGRKGHMVIEQVRAIDRSRIDRIAGTMAAESVRASLLMLSEMFAE
jgi:mRNA interferase MazF